MKAKVKFAACAAFVLLMLPIQSFGQNFVFRNSSRADVPEASTSKASESSAQHHGSETSIVIKGGRIFSNGQECYESGCYSTTIEANVDHFTGGVTAHNGCGPWHTEADQATRDEQINLQDVPIAQLAGANTAQAAAAPIQRGSTTMIYVAYKHPLFAIPIGDTKAGIDTDFWFGGGMLLIKDLDPTSFQGENVVVQRGTSYPVFMFGASLDLKLNSFFINAKFAINTAISNQDPTFSYPNSNLGTTRIDVGKLQWAEWNIGLGIPISRRG